MLFYELLEAWSVKVKGKLGYSGVGKRLAYSIVDLTFSFRQLCHLNVWYYFRFIKGSLKALTPRIYKLIIYLSRLLTSF